jgi:hypothetical protein
LITFSPSDPEDLVEGGREFAVAVADQDPMALRLLSQGHRQVARLLGEPCVVRFAVTPAR